MKFSEVLESLVSGKLIRRKCWSEGVFIVKCNDVGMAKSDLTSVHVPTAAKLELLKTNSRNVIITGQVKLVSAGTDLLGSKSTITDYNPNWTDILSNDWEII